MNVLVLTESLNAGREVAEGFSTQESLHSANRLADYLNAVPQGRTVRGMRVMQRNIWRRFNASEDGKSFSKWFNVC